MAPATVLAWVFLHMCVNVIEHSPFSSVDGGDSSADLESSQRADRELEGGGAQSGKLKSAAAVCGARLRTESSRTACQ